METLRQLFTPNRSTITGLDADCRTCTIVGENIFPNAGLASHIRHLRNTQREDTAFFHPALNNLCDHRCRTIAKRGYDLHRFNRFQRVNLNRNFAADLCVTRHININRPCKDHLACAIKLGSERATQCQIFDACQARRA